MTWLEQLEEIGIRRLGSPTKGFRYRDANGRSIRGADLARLRALKLPPAWTDVRINPAPTGRLQAIGKDRAGRWQYRYHPAFIRRQEEKKYQRLLEFAEALPRMRRALARDLRKPFLSREMVLAWILRILATSFIRPGSQVYAEENGSYGLATLRKRHLAITGDTVRFSFRGKSKQHQTRELRDPQLARTLRRLRQIPGARLFKYRNGDAKLIGVRRRHINEYIKEVMGQSFSAKDFRTWAGTLVCACALARVGVSRGETASRLKRKIVSAVKETAGLLGNTPAICRGSYIQPSIFSAFERGRVVESYFRNLEELVAYRGWALHESERALLALLELERRGGVEALRKAA
jgi:DNA topoisomerase-1